MAKCSAMSAASFHPAPQLVWENHEQFVRSLLLGYLPESVQVFGQWMKNCYVEKLLLLAQEEFLQTVHTYDDKEYLPSWICDLAKRVVANNFDAIKGTEPLVDEETVRLAQAGSERAAQELMERYLPKIRATTRRMVFTQGICPRHVDVESFIGDVVGVVSQKVFSGLDTYAFAAPFKYWVDTICENAAYDLRDKEVGQAAGGPREYISWNEFEGCSRSYETVRATHYRMLVWQLLDEHGSEGPRAAKSKDALLYTYYEGLSAKEVAERLETTPAYVNQLISHDYREIRKMAEERHGLLGSDL